MLRPSIHAGWSELLTEVLDDARAFWDRGRIQRALIAVVGILLLEVVVTAALHAGLPDPRGRGPTWLHTVVNLLGLKASWVQSLVMPRPLLDQDGFEAGFRETALLGLINSFVMEFVGIVTGLLIPVIAAVSFIRPGQPGGDAIYTAGGSPLRRLVLRGAATVGPLIVIAFVVVLLRLMSQLIADAHATYAPLGLYPSQWLAKARWAWFLNQVVFYALAILMGSAVYLSISAAMRDPAAAIPACLGAGMFAIPLIVYLVLKSVPLHIILALPLTVYVDLAVEAVVVAVALPFALRSLRSDARATV